MTHAETNIKCPKCGEEMFKCENLRHIYYVCPNCRELLAVKGQEHYFHCDEIDVIIGKIIPYKEVSS